LASSYGFQRGFTGYHLDAESGLCYARARMYSAALGRFIGRDSDPVHDHYVLPEVPLAGNTDGGVPLTSGYNDGWNLYAAYFAPNFVDPSGNESICWTYVIKTLEATGECTRWVFSPTIFGKGNLGGWLPFPIPNTGSGFWKRRCLYTYSKYHRTSCVCCPPPGGVTIATKPDCTHRHSFEGGAEWRSQVVFANGYKGPPNEHPESPIEDRPGYYNGGPDCCPKTK